MRLLFIKKGHIEWPCDCESVNSLLVSLTEWEGGRLTCSDKLRKLH